MLGCIWICLKSLLLSWLHFTKCTLEVGFFFCFCFAAPLLAWMFPFASVETQNFSMLKYFWTLHGTIMEQAFINSRLYETTYKQPPWPNVSPLLLHLRFWDKWLDTSLKNGEVKTGKRCFSESVNSCGFCTDYILCVLKWGLIIKHFQIMKD